MENGARCAVVALMCEEVTRGAGVAGYVILVASTDNIGGALLEWIWTAGS